ncbi:hypothetical protein AB4525_08200 [Vibrio breoganii]
MSYFLVKVCIYTGEYEKSSTSFVKADNQKDAADTAIYGESHSPESLDWSNQVVEDMGGEFLYSIKSIIEVQPCDVDALERYLTLYYHDAEELASSGNYLQQEAA